jgi:hypothetical protein
LIIIGLILSLQLLSLLFSSMASLTTLPRDVCSIIVQFLSKDISSCPLATRSLTMEQRRSPSPWESALLSLWSRTIRLAAHGHVGKHLRLAEPGGIFSDPVGEVPGGGGRSRADPGGTFSRWIILTIKSRLDSVMVEGCGLNPTLAFLTVSE